MLERMLTLCEPARIIKVRCVTPGGKPMADEPKIDNPIASLGGKARAARMTPAERKVSAQRAAAARWARAGRPCVPTAVCGSPDRPLRIGNVEIPCYVLDDDRRVIVQGGMLKALDMAQGTGGGGEGDRLTKFVSGKAISPFVSSELRHLIENPIRFRVPSNGVEAYGYEATVLADICHAIIEADHKKKLQKQQSHIAAQCVALTKAFAKLGIVALVDEATGYQSTRARDALARILEAYIAKELRPYVRTFEPDFYEAVCRLKGWEFKTSSRRPRALAQITNDLVYARLAPGVLEELRRKNPIVKDGRRKDKHHQWLTEQKGHPELQKHIAKVTGWAEMAIQAGQGWVWFYKYVNKKKPPHQGRTLFDEIPPDPEECSPEQAD